MGLCACRKDDRDSGLLPVAIELANRKTINGSQGVVYSRAALAGAGGRQEVLWRLAKAVFRCGQWQPRDALQGRGSSSMNAATSIALQLQPDAGWLGRQSTRTAAVCRSWAAQAVPALMLWWSPGQLRLAEAHGQSQPCFADV